MSPMLMHAHVFWSHKLPKNFPQLCSGDSIFQRQMCQCAILNVASFDRQYIVKCRHDQGGIVKGVGDKPESSIRFVHSIMENDNEF